MPQRVDLGEAHAVGQPEPPGRRDAEGAQAVVVDRAVISAAWTSVSPAAPRSARPFARFGPDLSRMDMTGVAWPGRVNPAQPPEDPMRTHAQAVVIGGGVVGCSILYHLAKMGWSDVVLLERDELTSGSTWHAAANIHGLHDVTNISRLQHYTMNLYRELEAETGQSCGVFQPGSLYLAQTEDREHQLRLQEAKARRYGMNFHEVSRAEAERLHPLVNYDGVRLIMFEPDGGNVDPSGVTNAYALGARQRGAEKSTASRP